jgi:hypothetical protein
MFRYVQYRNIEKPNNLKMFGKNKTKASKQDSQNRFRPHMHDGGEPSFDDI